MERKEEHLSERERQQVIALRNRGMLFREIADTLGIPLSTCSFVVRMAGREKPPPHKCGRKKKFLQNLHGRFIARKLDDDCTLTLEQLATMLQRQYHILFSHSTIARAIKEFHYSFKRTDLRTERSETLQSIHEKEAYAEQFHATFGDHKASFFFMDEVGFSVSMRRPYGYSPRNSPAVVTAPAIRSRNFSVIALIGMPRGDPLEKVMIMKVLPTAANTELCRLFFTEALETLHSRGIGGGTIVLDNVPFHHSRRVTELFPDGGPFSLMFLPPSSPFFNPIENVFSAWKDMVRKEKPRNEDELMSAIALTSVRISAETIMNCIEHIDRNCEKYASGDHNVQ